MKSPSLLPSHEIRARFAHALSDMYRQEVPLYRALVSLVEEINAHTLQHRPQLREALDQQGDLQRLSAERHGAIRLGSAHELYTMRRVFAVMGMFPVGYYDLSEAGIPVHSTAFRPVSPAELNANPFRMFTSLLRLDLVENKDLRQRARELLRQRQIFTPRLLQLVDRHERQHGLDENQADAFVAEALQTFRWHETATVDRTTYRQLLDTHPLIADIVCFHGPHINHLTPRTLDIDAAQNMMPRKGMQPKSIVEGPPQREIPILLRQTSFQALKETVHFIGNADSSETGSHSARFGEIEQRGMALTPKGRKLYDRLLNDSRRLAAEISADADGYYRQLQAAFRDFPDDALSMHRQGLGYFHYRPQKKPSASVQYDLHEWIENGSIGIKPITYEDFLPVSAAGIFRSNLGEHQAQSIQRSPSQQVFEQDLGCAVLDEFNLYADLQKQSLTDCLQQLGIAAPDIDPLLAQSPGNR